MVYSLVADNFRGRVVEAENALDAQLTKGTVLRHSFLDRAPENLLTPDL